MFLPLVFVIKRLDVLYIVVVESLQDFVVLNQEVEDVGSIHCSEVYFVDWEWFLHQHACFQVFKIRDEPPVQF